MGFYKNVYFNGKRGVGEVSGCLNGGFGGLCVVFAGEWRSENGEDGFQAAFGCVVRYACKQINDVNKFSGCLDGIRQPEKSV